MIEGVKERKVKRIEKDKEARQAVCSLTTADQWYYLSPAGISVHEKVVNTVVINTHSL